MGVILDICAGKRVVGLQMSTEGRAVLPSMCACSFIRMHSPSVVHASTVVGVIFFSYSALLSSEVQQQQPAEEVRLYHRVIMRNSFLPGQCRPRLMVPTVAQPGLPILNLQI